MSLRWIAALAAFGLVVAASAGEKKKLEFAPETGPQPRQVPAADGMALPNPAYLQQPPKYLPADPTFPLVRELSYQVPVCPACAATKAAVRQMVRSYAVADLVIPLPSAGAAPTDPVKT